MKTLNRYDHWLYSCIFSAAAWCLRPNWQGDSWWTVLRSCRRDCEWLRRVRSSWSFCRVWACDLRCNDAQSACAKVWRRSLPYCCKWQVDFRSYFNNKIILEFIKSAKVFPQCSALVRVVHQQTNMWLGARRSFLHHCPVYLPHLIPRLLAFLLVLRDVDLQFFQGLEVFLRLLV